MSTVHVLQLGDKNLPHTDIIGEDTSEKSIKI